MSRYEIDIGTFENVELSEESGVTKLRFETKAHGDIHMELGQLSSFMDRMMDILELEGIIEPPVRPPEFREPWEPEHCSLELVSCGPRKIHIMRALRQDPRFQNRSLLQLKDTVESAPCLLLDGVTREDAAKLFSSLEKLGADVRIHASD